MSQVLAEQYHTYQEIVNHAGAWRDVLTDLQAQASKVKELSDGSQIEEVIFIGCGSTHYLARTAAFVCQSLTGIPSIGVPSSELVLFPATVLAKDTHRLLVPISRSGTTTETLRAIEVFQERSRGPIIGVTCYEQSDMASTVDAAIVARAAHEQSVAQTRSFTTMLVGVIGLIAQLVNEEPGEALGRLPEISERILTAVSPLMQQLGTDASFEKFFFLGSGPLYGLACEAMLKMKEMSLSHSEAFHFLEFRHGPMSIVDKRALVVGLLSESAFLYEWDVLTEMRKLGACILAITPRPLEAGLVDWHVGLPAGFPDALRGPLYLPPLQMLAFHRALHKEVNPDRPANLTAVVNLDMETMRSRKG